MRRPLRLALAATLAAVVTARGAGSGPPPAAGAEGRDPEEAFYRAREALAGLAAGEELLKGRAGTKPVVERDGERLKSANLVLAVNAVPPGKGPARATDETKPFFYAAVHVWAGRSRQPAADLLEFTWNNEPYQLWVRVFGSDAGLVKRARKAAHDAIASSAPGGVGGKDHNSPPVPAGFKVDGRGRLRVWEKPRTGVPDLDGQPVGASVSVDGVTLHLQFGGNKDLIDLARRVDGETVRVTGVLKRHVQGTVSGLDGVPPRSLYYLRVTGLEPPGAGSDLGRLRGNWSAAHFEYEGKKEPADLTKALRVTVRDDLITIEGYGETRARVRLDPTRRPAAIDLVSLKDPAHVTPGVYEFAGDTVKICLRAWRPDVKSPERPAGFKTDAPGSGLALFVLKRDPPEAPAGEPTVAHPFGGEGRLSTFKTLPDPAAVTFVLVTARQNERNRPLTLEDFPALLRTARPVRADDATVRTWGYAPWCDVEFRTAAGRYRMSLYLGGRALLATPEGAVGLVSYEDPAPRK